MPKKLPENKLESIGVSEETNKAHLILWQNYAKKNNEIVELLDQRKDLKNVNSVFSELRSQKLALTFSYGGYINHKIFFNHLNGDGKPNKEFLALISSTYGNFNNWVNDFRATCLASMGWGFICYDYESETIQNVIGDSQNTFPVWNCQLIGAIDLYEHAYFADFHTDKEKYINSILSIFDYDNIVGHLK